MTTDSTRPPLDADELIAAWKVGDDEVVLTAFHGRSELERRAVAPALFEAARHPEYPERPAYPHEYDDTVMATLFACGTLTEIKRLEHRFGPMCNELTFQVLVERRPPWVTAWAEWALDRNASPSGSADGLWWMVRKLIRAGVCEPLDSDGYILCMIGGLSDHGYLRRRRWTANEHNGVPGDPAAYDRWRERRHSGLPRVVDLLRADPELIDHEIWRLFEVPGRPSCGLGPPDRNGQHWWISTFVALADDGDIDRARLLETTLDALARDISQHQSRWFVALWKALEPTDDERAALQDSLLHLVVHPVNTVVRFALEELSRLEGTSRVDAARLCDEIDGVLLSASVDVAEQGLRLLERVVRRDRTYATPAAVAATSGLLHANVRVRQHAAKLLDASAALDKPAVRDAITAAGFAPPEAGHHGLVAQVDADEPAPEPVNAVTLERPGGEEVPRREAAWRRVVVDYLDEWLPMMVRNVPKVGVVDVSPGPWRFDTADALSPAFVVNAVIGHPKFQQWRSKTFVVDVVDDDPERAKMLTAAFDPAITGRATTPENVHVTTDAEPFSSRTRTYHRELEARPPWGPCPIVAFADPFASSVPMLQLASTLQASTDVLVRVDARALEDLRSSFLNPGNGHTLDSALTSMFATIDRHHTREGWLELYERQLRDIARYEYVTSYELLADGAPTGEFMVFGTGNQEHLRKMKDVIWAIDPERGSRFTSPAEPIPTPVGDEHLRPLADLLSREFDGHKVEVWRMKDFVLRTTRFRDNAHVRPTLTMLQREGGSSRSRAHRERAPSRTTPK